MEQPSISICVPAYNEENTLKESIDDLMMTLLPLVRKLEVIIVNDGSRDSTPQIVKQLSGTYPEVKIINHKKNLGIGISYRDALAVSGGDYFTWFPADHENPAEEFIRCLPYLSKDTIITCHHQGFDNRSALRRFISRAYIKILNSYFHLNLKYYNGLTIFPSSLLRSVVLNSNGFVLFAESVIQAVRRGCRVVELAAPLREYKGRKSKATSLTSVIQSAKDLVHILVNINRGSG